MACQLVVLEARDLEVGRQGDLQEVDLLLGRPDRLRVGAVQRDALGVEAVPYRGVGVGGLELVAVEAGNAPQVGQRRHVHDRHARHLRLADRIQQLAHAVDAILRLLHGEPDQVVVGRVDARHAARGHLAGQLFRIEQHRVLAAADRQADLEALLVDQVGLGGQADEMDGMAAKQHFRGQQRAVGRPQQQDLVSHFPISLHDSSARLHYSFSRPARGRQMHCTTICLPAR